MTTQKPLPGTQLLHVGAPNILNRELFLTRVNQILDTKILTNDGPFVRELENYCCSLLGAAHCVAVANATLGLELVIEALELKGEVIVPSFTFVATVHAIKRNGLVPIFCDTECGGSGLMDVSAAESLITENTVAIMPVNIYGNLCDIPRFSRLAENHNLRLVFDSAHALGTSYKGQYVGAFGDAEVFSLHATKFVQGFEGGLITTNNSELAEKLRLLRNYGFVGYDMVACLGTNAKLSEIHAAMALTNMECLEEMVAHNRATATLYENLLPEPLELMQYSPGVDSNFQYVVAKVPAHLRDDLVDGLQKAGVLARKYFYPGVHKFSPYDSVTHNLPNTDEIASRVVCLPTGWDVTEEMVKATCSLAGELISSSKCVSS